MKTNKFRLSTEKERRLIESQRMLDAHPNSLPLIVQSLTIKLSKNKYLVPCNMMAPQFLYFLRKQVNLSSSEAMFLFVETVNETEVGIGTTFFAPTTSSIEELYASSRHTDGFLYCYIERENTFGSSNTICLF